MKRKKILGTWWTGVAIFTAIATQGINFTQAEETPSQPPFKIRTISGGLTVQGHDPARSQLSPVKVPKDTLPAPTLTIVGGYDPGRDPNYVPVSNLSTNTFRPLIETRGVIQAQSRITLSGDRKQVILSVPSNSTIQTSTSLNSTTWEDVQTPESGNVTLPILDPLKEEARFFRIQSDTP